MLTKILENLGLTSKEAKIYLANLEIGSSPVSAIAQNAKMNRVTSYDILEKLVQKGLVSFISKNKIKYFTAIDPELLIVDFKKKTLELEQALPDLKRLHGDTSHPQVHYFEGLEGIKHIYADTLTSKTEILNYCNSEEIRKFLPNYDKDYVQKRVKKNIFLRGIAPNDQYGIDVQSHDSSSNREIRLIPKDQFNFTNEINIYDDKVAIISFKNELIGMIIESAEVANTQRAIFKMVWEFAETFSKKKSFIKNFFDRSAAESQKENTRTDFKVERIKKASKKEKANESQESLF